jgi:hypothetical protein
MVRQIGMGYGVWESLVHLAGNRVGGHEKVWVMGGYGLLEVWVKTEATVQPRGHRRRNPRNPPHPGGREKFSRPPR